MTPITLQQLADHRPTKKLCALTVGNLILTMEWHKDGWTLFAVQADPPHPLLATVVLACVNAHIDSVIPTEVFTRLAKKVAP